jgi:hypothetical protein
MNVAERRCSIRAHAGRTVAAAMKVFDNLPAEVREALNDARLNFCVWCARDLVKKFGPEMAVKMVQQS